MENTERAPRYSLILETVNNDKYYFDTRFNSFVHMYSQVNPIKTDLQTLDYLTSLFSDKKALAEHYGINEDILRAYITYQFKGEKRIAPVFNNEIWSKIAASYRKKEVDFTIETNRDAFNEVYYEIANLDSDFGDLLVKNENRMINLSPKTIATIVGLRAHENAIRLKSKFGYPVNSSETLGKVSQIYSEDRYGFYQDLKKRLSKYREFRTVYLNYCHYTNKTQKVNIQESISQKKKAITPPHQMSIFDKNE